MNLSSYLEALSDVDQIRREEAVDALAELRSDEVIDALASFPRTGVAWKSAARVLGRIGAPRAVGILSEALRSESREACLVACLALADGGDGAEVILIQALAHQFPEVRARSAMALGRRRASGALVPLIGALQDVDSQVRMEAILAIAALRDDRSISGLCKALEDPEASVRQSVPIALGEIASPAAIEALKAATRHQDEELRWIADWQLKNMSN